MGTYLGQNFLTDSKVRKYIADKIGDLYKKLNCNTLIEIGPGKGAITKLIDQISDNFIVIEKDEQLIQNLEFRMQNGELNIKQIINSDVLEVDVDKFLKEKKLKTKQTLVVGNLPYYITSPILRKFFANPGASSGANGKPQFPGGIFMLQNEVGEKIKSDAKKKSYLRWLLNYGYDVTYLKMVPAKAFSPAPKVKSCLIQLRILDVECGIKWNKLIEFLELYSGFSRKTMGAIQKILIKHGSKLCDKQSINIDKHGLKLVDSGRKRTSPEGQFKIPENLQKKRLEELDREDLGEIINS